MQTTRFYVYGYSLDGIMLYIGKGTKERYKDHLWQCYDKETYWSRALRKMLDKGIKLDSFIIQGNLTNEEALFLEEELIKKYGKRLDKSGTLYNMADGGSGPVGWKMNEEQRERCRQRMLGNNRALGLIHTEETKAKIANSIRGIVRSAETNKKKSLALSWQVEEQIQKCKDYVKDTWWGPHITITYDGETKRQSANATHRLFTVKLEDIIIKRTITDFRQGSCPIAFAKLKDKYK
ncbi:MAG: hypothetical protein IPJ03_17190 [Ignavibacteriales bacterium]|nr:hypothetical protein [Ignavibacteriales bacterium]